MLRNTGVGGGMVLLLEKNVTCDSKPKCAAGGVCTRVKLLGEAAHLLTVVRGHSCTTSFVFSSTRITDSLVIPSSLGTSLFLPFIFSCRMRKHHTEFVLVRTTYADDSFKAPGQRMLALA